jgi:hypothetical protein
VGNRDARDGGAADVIVGYQKGTGNAAQDADLVSDVHDVGSGRWLDLADDLEIR